MYAPLKLRVFAPCLVFLLLLLTANQARAWGTTAHKIVCEIALHELNSKARSEVERLMKLDSEFSDFAESCDWPAHPRKRSKEHYVNLPRMSAGLEREPCPLTDKCVVTAIDFDFEILRDPNASDAKRLEALKYLGHWIGDIHQPLHVSFQDDRGGNLVWGTGKCENKLHLVWDDCMVESDLGTDVKKAAAELRRTITDGNRSLWNGSHPLGWANESFMISTSEAVGYCTKIPGGCWYAPNRMEFLRGDNLRVVMVDSAYMKNQLPVIRKRLIQAGVRLGHWLNLALGGQSLAGSLPADVKK